MPKAQRDIIARIALLSASERLSVELLVRKYGSDEGP
jgi:hypothetical protein